MELIAIIGNKTELIAEEWTDYTWLAGVSSIGRCSIFIHRKSASAEKGSHRAHKSFRLTGENKLVNKLIRQQPNS